MARRSKPFLYRGWYCTNAGGVPQQKLCREEQGHKSAEVALARLLVQKADAKQEGKLAVPGPGVRAIAEQYAPGLAGPQPKTVAEVFNDFMTVKKAETDEATYSWYQDKLAAFYNRFATRPISSIDYEEGLTYKSWLRKEKKWKRGKKPMKGLGNTTVNHYVRAAKTLLGWACKPSRRQKYGMSVNPWEEIKYLTEKSRERLITDEEFRHLIANCTDGNVAGGAQDFREMLTVLRYTTMRPGELRVLQWDYVQWDNNRLVFPPTVIKTRNRREATMIDMAKNTLLARKARLEASGAKVSGYVFPVAKINSQGKRTTVGSDQHQSSGGLAQRVRRLMTRCVNLGLIEKEKAGETIVAYSTRHTRSPSCSSRGMTTPL
jgi:integrase